MILVFLRFTSISQFLHQLSRLSMHFWSPNLDFDNIIKSSAYRRQLNLLPFGSINGSELVLSNIVANSFI